MLKKTSLKDREAKREILTELEKDLMHDLENLKNAKSEENTTDIERVGYLAAVLNQIKTFEHFYKSIHQEQEPRFNIVLEGKQGSYTALQFISSLRGAGLFGKKLFSGVPNDDLAL